MLLLSTIFFFQVKIVQYYIVQYRDSYIPIHKHHQRFYNTWTNNFFSSIVHLWTNKNSLDHTRTCHNDYLLFSRNSHGRDRRIIYSSFCCAPLGGVSGRPQLWPCVCDCWGSCPCPSALAWPWTCSSPCPACRPSLFPSCALLDSSQESVVKYSSM